jgi:tRNA(fMet)-specific endonuclease VapC
LNYSIGRDSGQTANAFKLLKMFVKGKGAFQFERPHDGEPCISVKGSSSFVVFVICIYLIKKKPPSVIRHFDAYHVGTIGISSITVAELECGVQKSRYPSENQEALEQFLLPLVVLDFDHQAARAYGKLRALLESRTGRQGRS